MMRVRVRSSTCLPTVSRWWFACRVVTTWDILSSVMGRSLSFILFLAVFFICRLFVSLGMVWSSILRSSSPSSIMCLVEKFVFDLLELFDVF